MTTQIQTATAVLIANALLFSASALAHDNQVSVSVKDGKRCFISNGLPDHSTGIFPNSGNPNGIEAQKISMCVTTSPKRNSRSSEKGGAIGIGINGVQFRPGTAGYYDGTVARKNSRNPASGWKLEGITPGNILGMDKQNAHVGPNGLYHYHGVANALVKSAGKGPIGYAADGFEIYYGGAQRSSYRLKSGTRPTENGAPGGTYDGTYEKDWLFAKGSGSLDECNGTTVNGKYTYFVTEAYPYVPRCLWGTPSKDFAGPDHGGEARGGGNGEARGQRQQRQDGNSGNSQRGNRQQQGQNRQQSNSERRGPPEEAINACTSKAAGASCSFKGRRGNRQISGSCKSVQNDVKACVPDRRG